MDGQELSEKKKRLGLKPYHLQDVHIGGIDELIEHVTQSGLLYRTAIQNLTLNKLRDHMANQAIEPDDELAQYFPKKHRKSLWNNFRKNFPLKAPGLKLTRFAQVLCGISVLGFVYLNYLIFTEGFEIVLALKLAGFGLYPLLVIFFVILGIITTYGSNRLPAGTVYDLMDKVVSLNHANLLSYDKAALKTLLKQELTNKAAHNNV